MVLLMPLSWRPDSLQQTNLDGGTFDADDVFFDPSTRARIILGVAIVTIGSDTSLGRSARTGLDGVNALLRERARRKNARLYRCPEAA